jgi:hypothetical protein
MPTCYYKECFCGAKLAVTSHIGYPPIGYYTTCLICGKICDVRYHEVAII